MVEDIKQILNGYKEETKRHFDVVADDIKDKIGGVSEQVATNTEKITALQEDMNKVKDDLDIIKVDI